MNLQLNVIASEKAYLEPMLFESVSPTSVQYSLRKQFPNSD